MPTEFAPVVAALASPQGYRGGGGLPIAIAGSYGNQQLVAITGRLQITVAPPNISYAERTIGASAIHYFAATTLYMPIASALFDFGRIPEAAPTTSWRARELAWRHANARLLQDRYRGNWIALEGDQIVAHGLSAAEVARRARIAGIAAPYLFRVTPDEGPDVGSFGL